MDWDKLRVFHAVADAGSLTHAGDQLQLSQSAISRQIRGLEEQLQTTLFHRHARGLLLTEQGELLFDATRAISQRLVATEARIRDAKDEVTGTLTVTTTAGFGTLWLTPRLPRLFHAHPNLSLTLVLTESILDLPMREADVAIRMSAPLQGDLIRRPLMQMTMRLYAAPDYIARSGQPVRASDMSRHRLITYSPDANQPHEAADWLRLPISPDRNTHLTVNSYFGVLTAVRAGLGIAALPDYVTRDYPQLVNVLVEETSPPIHVYLVFPEELRKSQRVLAFRDFVLREVDLFNREPEEGAPD